MAIWIGVLSAVAAWIAVALIRRTYAAVLPAAMLSIAVTAIYPRPDAGTAARWDAALLPAMVEYLAFAVLAVVVVRRAPVGQAAVSGAGAVLANGVQVLRLITPATWLSGVGACALWTMIAVVPALIGVHLRRQDQRRADAAARAADAQRRQVARDLHDYVAHDISEMVASAQAGSVVGDRDPAQAAVLFRRIDEAGQRALAAMDRTVHLLERADSPALGDLPALVARFDAAGTVRAHLSVAAGLDGIVPDAVGALAYRVVSESLTNVRRHAPTASLAVVELRRSGNRLTVLVRNDLPREPPPPTAARGGRGLPNLSAAVEEFGGELEAGPDADGWRVTATLPLPSGWRS
ncbi:sensor histidine kinase [Cryptosporangium minutisporangium]|uniref:histidine kinase n=1 Tax=Cryptosporangium minutisporangium TaxID=113569 RepID=A0ABP6SRT2_9ACTN